MKSFFLLFALLISLNISYAQSNQTRISQIDTEIKAAADKGDYELAASLKKEKEILISIDKAIAAGNYEEAAKLKKSLSSLPSAKRTQIDALQKQIDAAVASGDYEKAAQLKNEIEAIKNSSSASNKEMTISQKTSEINPEFLNQVYIWDKQSNSLRSMEKQEGEIKTSTVAAPFYASSTSYYYISGPNSTIEINNNETFIVKTYQGIDPAEQFKLIRFDSDKNGTARLMPYMKSEGYAYGGSSGKVDKNIQNITFRRFKDNIFEIQTNNLENGEYGFMYINKFFCFRKGPISVQSFIPQKKNNNAEENYITKSGTYFDGLLQGVGGSSYYNTSNPSPYSGFSAGFRVGTKWFNKRSNNRYKPGVGVSWMGFNFIGTSYSSDVLVGLYPFQVGFCNAIAFNDRIGMEVDFFLGVASLNPNWDFSDNFFGFKINPSVKFRYKKLSVGLDIAYQWGYRSIYPNDFFINATFFGLTVGYKTHRKPKQ